MPMPGRVNSMAAYRFGYNKGSERDDEIAGVGNTYTTLHRELDARLARWWSIDPEKHNNASISPYCSMDNSPIIKNDEKGDFALIDNLVAGAVSGLAEYAVQVTSNYIEGKDHPFTDIKWGKVAVSAAAGALTDGLSEGAVFAKLGANGAKLAKNIAPYAIDAGKSVANQVVEGKGVSLTKVVSDVVISKGAGVVAKKIAPKIASAETKLIENNLDRAKRVLAGNAPRASRIVKVDNLTKQLQSTQLYNKVVSKVNDLTTKTIKNEIKQGVKYGQNAAENAVNSVVTPPKLIAKQTN